MKYCNNCNLEKPYTDFHKDKSKAFGVSSQCKICVIARNGKYRESNRDKCRAYTAYYEKTHKESVNAYFRNKRATDPLFKLLSSCRVLIGKKFKDNNHIKASKTVDILGCSMNDFKEYIQKQFSDGMTWDNYGSMWHLDHIIPVMWKNDGIVTEEKIIERNHYTNFQPMWAVDNYKKQNKFIG